MDIAYPGDLTWDAVTLDSRHAEIRPIEIAYGRQTDRGAIMNVRHFAWTILPLTPGPLTLRFGRLTARHAGPIEIIPAPPPVRIDVRAVPGFMPADSVIGRPAATILYASHRLNVGQTGLLSLQLSGIGLIRPMVAAVFDPPPKSPGLRFDPPLIRRMLTSNDSLTNVWRIDLTFRTMHAGHVVYPRLRISYFDPMDGVPRAIFVRPRSLRIADPMRRRIELAIAVSVVIFLSGVIGWFGVRAVRREILIARARARLRDARTAVQARDILLSWPFAPKSATLRKWLNCVAPADPAITRAGSGFDSTGQPGDFTSFCRHAGSFASDQF
jgi:hypothetical protein